MCSFISDNTSLHICNSVFGPPFPTPPDPDSLPAARIQVTGEFRHHIIPYSLCISFECAIPHSTFIQNTTAPSSRCPTAQPVVPSCVIRRLQAERTGRSRGRRVSSCHDKPDVEVKGWCLVGSGGGLRRKAFPSFGCNPIQ